MKWSVLQRVGGYRQNMFCYMLKVNLLTVYCKLEPFIAAKNNFAFKWSSLLKRRNNSSR